MSLNIIVGIKRVYPPTYHTGSAVVNWINNPFDEVALEGALRLKEKDSARRRVTVVSVGTPAQAKQCEDGLRYGLSMGADSALRVILPHAPRVSQQQQDKGQRQGPTQTLSPRLVARAFVEVAKRRKANLLMFGQQSPDFSDCQVPQLTAGMLDWNQALFVNKLACEEKKGKNGKGNGSAGQLCLRATCETDHGNEVLEMGLPAVVSCHTRLAAPRIPKLPNVLKARRAKIEQLTLSDGCFSGKNGGYTIEGVEKVQEKSRKRKMCKDVKELMDALRADGF